MNSETAQAIVERVAQSHPKFKPYDTTYYSDCGKVTFQRINVDPRTIVKWFADEAALAFSIGMEMRTETMVAYFREVQP
jgi:hypothetical protein